MARDFRCVFRSCGDFVSREHFLDHVQGCPHVFPAVREAARDELAHPRPADLSPKAPPTHPDFFDSRDTSTLPKKVPDAHERPATY